MKNDTKQGVDVPDLDNAISDKPVVSVEEGDGNASALELGSADASLPVLVLKSPDKKVVTINDVRPDHLPHIDNISKAVDFGDSNVLITFGTRPQEKLQEKLKTLLVGVKVKDLGKAGDLVLQMVEVMDYLKVDELKAELLRADDDNWKNFMARLPLIGRMFGSVNLYLERRKELVDKLNQIDQGAKADRRNLIEEIAKLDALFRGIEGNFYEVGVYIVGGEKALLRGSEEFRLLREKASQSGNPLDISRVVTFHENLMAFDDTLMELKMAYVRAPITAQRIRLIQRVGRDQVRKITHDLMFTLTQLMEGIIQLNTLLDIAQSQANSKERGEAVARISKFSDEMLTLTTETAHRNRLNVLKQVEEIEAQSRKVLELMRRRGEMDKEVEKANREAESMLVRIQTNFHEGLKQIVEESPTADLGISQ